jgi:Sulfotransferase domain
VVASASVRPEDADGYPQRRARTETVLRNRVDFFGLGVQKAATTWLYECLDEHPKIGTPGLAGKEMNFFNHRYASGYESYHSHFRFDTPISGEFSVSYFWDRNVPLRLHTYNPDAKLILSLRHPVERAISQHLHAVRRGHLPPRLHGFSAALAQNPSYVEQGRYATHLERWLERFDMTRLHVVLVDDIRSAPHAVLRDVFTFLDVDAGFRPGLASDRRNVAGRYRSPRLRHVVHGTGRGLRWLLGERGFRLVRRTGVPAVLRRVNEVAEPPAGACQLTSGEREMLLAEFGPEIDRLEALIGRDLSAWKR